MQQVNKVEDKNIANEESKGKRMTIFLPENLVKHLEWLAEVQGISQAEAIRKAIATESFMQREINQGSKVLIETEGSVKEVVFR
ncbi:MAG: CopG family transcriptional regulator [Prochloraceae cyanobacterium]|nr:CopG family transcriptional regulator [Prochloraceae cyanobacterium]